jgi:hypothetical protein
MTMIRKGNLTGNNTITQANNSLQISKEGVARLTARFVCNTTALSSVIPAPGTEHPTFATLFARESIIVTQTAEKSLVEMLYEGYSTVLPPATWSISGSTGEQSIRLSENWDDIKSLAEADDGYIEDENGAFLEFTAPESLAGVESFLAPKLILTQRYVTTTFPTSEQASNGKIDTPPSSGANGWETIPSLTTGSESWLKVNFESEDLGFKKAYLITNQWLKSGPKGWSSTIYS